MSHNSPDQTTPQEYETLVLIGNGRSTLDHLVQALDAHVPPLRALVDALEYRGLIHAHSDWGTGCLRFALTQRGHSALEADPPDGARNADTLREDESRIIATIERDGTVPDSADLHWHASSTVQFLWEAGDLAVSGMIRPRLSTTRST